MVNDMNGEIERLTGLTLRFVVNKVGGEGVLSGGLKMVIMVNEEADGEEGLRMGM